MTPAEIWRTIDLKLIAVLRGITPRETPEVVNILLDEGFRTIEVPLNSPDPYTSIRLAADIAAERGPCLIGAGTVLTAEEVARVQEAGGSIIVSPDVDPAVVGATLERGLASFPGVFTATEAHLALKRGATGLKVFPASQLGSAGIKAILATLPKDVQLCAVGGIGPDDFAEYLDVGVIGFGMGTSLYRPGISMEKVRDVAQRSATMMRR